MGAEVRSWRIHRCTGHTFAQLARFMNPIVRGWIQYHGAFYPSALRPFLQRINAYLLRWIRRKYKRLAGYRKARNMSPRDHAAIPGDVRALADVPHRLGSRVTRAV
ncbi:group II intron maturase-specific domain-containing protein [Streptomyces sp. NPDC056160]|uniref:group II intron maturase-specific domain-containing protein n=1 Tax=Streptomyces sp. NPDC056160 TaxID=3345731 RepID=UPI0035DD9352